jgi:prephenate dehydrogenase/chorismate mutase
VAAGLVRNKKRTSKKKREARPIFPSTCRWQRSDAVTSPGGEAAKGGEKKENSGGVTLYSLRRDIERATESIIDLLGERTKLSRSVAAVKKLNLAPIENLKVESLLIQKMQERGRLLGLDEGFVREFLELTFDFSKLVQRREYYEVSIKRFLEEESIRTVGLVGAGRMGRWFAGYFLALSTECLIFDRDPKRARAVASDVGARSTDSLESLVRGSDLLIVAVPVYETPSIVSKLVDLIGSASDSRNVKGRRSSSRRRPEIIEVASVKRPLVEGHAFDDEHEEQADGYFTQSSKGASDVSQDGRVVLISIHPMFGPDALHFWENTMIVIEGRGGKPSRGGVKKGKEHPELAYGFMKRLFPHFRLLKADVRTHDLLMAYVLTLPHVLSMIFGDVVSRSHLGGDLGIYAGPSFNRMLELSRRVFSESPDAYFDIESSNVENASLIREVEASIERLNGLLKDRQAFREFFKETNVYVSPSSSSSAQKV